SRNFQSYFLSSPRFQSTSLFPYTTLFRSKGTSGFCAFLCQQFLNIEIQCELVGMRPQTDSVHFLQTLVFQPGFNHVLREDIAPRSEEHTSELQSPDHLVCSLLLEKKKQNS